MTVYANAKTKILNYIQQNNLKFGDKLPTENEFSTLFGIGRLSLREGLNALKNEGIITSIQGRGTFVACNPEYIFNSLNINCSVTELILNSGHTPGCSYFEKEIVQADKNIADALNIPVGSDIVSCSRIRTADGIPVVHMTDYISPKLTNIFLGFTKDDLSLYDYIENHSSTLVGNSITEIKPVCADEKLANALEVSVGTPLLEHINKVIDTYGATIIYADEFFRADKFNFILTRGKNTSK